MLLVPIDMDACAPFLALSAPRDALHSRRIVRSEFGVDLVLRAGRRPQVAPSIVNTVSIFMIDLMCRPLSSHVEKCENVSPVLHAIDLNQDISRRIKRRSPGYFPRRTFWSRHDPRPKAHLGIIPHESFQTLDC